MKIIPLSVSAIDPVGLDREATPPGGRSWWTLGEVGLVVLLLLAHNWHWWHWVGLDAWRGWVRPPVIVLMVVMIVYSFLRLREGPTLLGLDRRQWRHGWVSMGLFTLAGLGVLLLVAWSLAVPHRVLHGWAWPMKYMAGMVGQQVGLQAFLNNRLFYFSQGWSLRTRFVWTVAGSSVLFALMHAPNVPLMLLVTVSGGVWVLHFRLYRNLPATMLSHLILGVGAMLLLGEGVLNGLRVGLAAVGR